jgi:hypothetical protein
VHVNADCGIMGRAEMTERAAYLFFLTAVGLGLGLLTIALAVIAVALIRQHRRARPR